MKPISLLSASLILVLFQSTANAFCAKPSFFAIEPSAPGVYSEPTPPFCLGNYRFTGEHSCSDWEINAYLDEVNSYIEDLATYARKAQAFAAEAENFALQALRYAECAADQAREPLG